MHVVAIVISGIWIAFWIYWLVASLSSKATRTRSGSFVAIRVAVILVILALDRAGLLMRQSAASHNPWLQVVGLALFLLGLALAVWARIYLGRNWGTPMSEKADPELVTTGPYRYVRHPIYSGIILGMIGTAVTVGLHWLVVAVFLGAFFVYSAIVEEHIMGRLFPDAYPVYMRSTKMLIPFIF
jgi:protein-S-isoprenylcysteine O-methyltransferase Ste14